MKEKLQLQYQEFKVEEVYDKIRLDLLVSKLKDISRNKAQKLIEEGKVFLNEEISTKKDVVKYGDIVKIEIKLNIKYEIVPLDRDLEILYQDDYIAVVNKPAGLITHPVYNEDDSLVHRLKFHIDKLSSGYDPLRPGIVHRLDRETSGLLLIAKDDNVQNILKEEFKNKTIFRSYIALVHGRLKNSITIENLIDRDRKNRKKFSVSDQGRYSKTQVSVLELYKYYTLVNCKLYTGRTHQIRVHLSHINHPVVFDDLYGFKKNKSNVDYQLLHAYDLKFIHPITKKAMEFNSPLPDYFKEFLEKIECSKDHTI